MAGIIYDFYRGKAKNAQHVQFVTDVLAAVPEAVATERGFAAQRAAFARAVDDELACFQKDRGYLETPEVVNSDIFRDDTYMYHKQVAQAHADYCPDATKREAGATVAYLFREAGQVIRADYASETAKISDVVEKMRQEPYASALEAIGMSGAADEIEAANQAFNEVYKKRAAKEYGRAATASMKELRTAADDAFDALAQAINALYSVNEMVTKEEATREALAKVIDDVNILVTRFRKTIGKKTPSVPTDPTEPTDPEEPTEPTDPEGGETESPGRI